MDGYAVRSVDIGHSSEDSPVALPLVGEIAAGTRTARRLQPHQTVYVATGAPLPTIADAVLPRSYVQATGARITVTRPVGAGAFVRRTGEDVQPGDVAVRSGAFIGAAQVGLLAAVGQAKVLVHPRPRLSIISIGDELVDVARTPGPGQVYDVNSFALAAAARDAGADVTRVGIAPADVRRLAELVEARLLVSEALVIAGAAGGHGAELVVEALSELGELDLTRVAMQPGSSQGFGLMGPDRGPDVPAAGEPGVGAGGVRGRRQAGAAADARPAKSVSPDRHRPHPLADPVAGRPAAVSCVANSCETRTTTTWCTSWAAAAPICWPPWPRRTVWC